MEQVKIEKVKPVFTDERGMIFDLLEEPVKHVGLITCNTGSIRGNHYHKKSVQYMYMIKGKIEMKTKDTRINDSKVEMKIIEEGDCITIPPLVIHSFRAIEQSVFLDMTTESRSGTGYEDDNFRVKI